MEKIRDIRSFVGESGMNLDKEERLLSESEYRECWNSIVNVSDADGLGCLENIKGTTNVFDLAINADFTLPTGTLRCNGSCRDEQNNAIIYFLADTTTTNHSIMRMFNVNFRCEWILKSQPLLNFKFDYKIKSASLIGDLLYWTDGYEGTEFVDYNPPRKINIKKAWAMQFPYDNSKLYQPGEYAHYLGTFYQYIYPTTSTAGILPTFTLYWEVVPDGVYTTITQQILDRIKYPPPYAPRATYNADPNTKANNLRGHLFQFAARYIYDDNEKSKFSAISNLGLPRSAGLLTGGYDEVVSNDNVITVTVNSGTKEVVAIEIAARQLNTGVWRIVNRKYKYDEYGNVLFGDNLGYHFQFYNNEVGEGVKQEDLFKFFDAVPQISQCHELIEKNRIIDADYIEGYDNIDIDVSLEWGINDFKDTGVEASYSTFDLLNTPNSRIEWYVGDVYDMGIFDTAVFDFTSVYTPGYSYLIYINAYNQGTSNPEYYRYTQNGTELNYHPYPVENKDDKVMGFASVTTGFGQSVESFINQIISQLRQGNGGDQSVIGFCYDGNTADNNHIWGDYLVQGDNIGGHKLTNKYQLGFIIRQVYQYTQWAQYEFPQPFPTPDLITLNIIKYKAIEKVPGFSSGAFHPFGLLYKDGQKRTGAVNENKKSITYVPSQNEYGYTHELFVNFIKWEIKHKPPIWAEYYQWVYAKNTTKHFSLMGLISAIGDAGGISGAGSILYFTINNNIQTAVETYPRMKINNYEWEEGDRVRFLFNRDLIVDATFNSITTPLDFEIIGVMPVASGSEYLVDKSGAPIVDKDGNKTLDKTQSKFLIDNFEWATYGIHAQDTIVEIYKPKKLTDDLVYYEFGEELPIYYPHTDNRVHAGGNGIDYTSTHWQRDQTASYSAKGVFMNGDAYSYFRVLPTLFPCESLWYSDYFDSEAIGIGKPCVDNRTMKRRRYFSKLLYSGAYVQDTQINDLSSVNSSDSVTLAEKFGDITFIKEVGFTLKILQKYKPSAIYIGRAGLTQANIRDNELLVANDSTLGTVVVSESDYGTLHPTSVAKHEKALYWYDINSGCILRDGANGIFPISDYGVKDFIRDKSKLFLTNGVDVYAEYDEFYNIVLFSFVDQTDSANDFTIGFHEPTNKWISFYNFTPDWMAAMKITTTSFDQDGQLWIHNVGTRMNFYGVQYKSKVNIVTNKEPLKVKILRSMALDSNKAWDVTAVRIGITNNYKRGMFSIIPKSWFEAIEGKWYSTFGKNMLTSGVQNNSDLINGDELRGSSAKIEMENTDTDEVKLFGVIINSTYSPKSG